MGKDGNLLQAYLSTREIENVSGASTEGGFVRWTLYRVRAPMREVKALKGCSGGHPGPEEKRGRREMWSQKEDLSVAGNVACKGFTP